MPWYSAEGKNGGVSGDKPPEEGEAKGVRRRRSFGQAGVFWPTRGVDGRARRRAPQSIASVWADVPSDAKALAGGTKQRVRGRGYRQWARVP